tara:strand:- start:526 stop:897 length:372 start_codon:yes stop_codon:yes gene_type:complete
MIVSVAAGGALGALSRWGMSLAVTRLMGHGFPWATLSVNVLGSIAMGMLIGWLSKYDQGYTLLRHAAVIGFLGSFTTFSTFSLDIVVLAERGAWTQAMLYGVSSFALAVGGLVAGLHLMRAVA